MFASGDVRLEPVQVQEDDSSSGVLKYNHDINCIVVPRTPTVEAVARLLQSRGVGRGLTVADLRRLHPARDVRRAAVVEALRFLEDLGVVRWNATRARWIGPLPPGARPLGVRVSRLDRDLALGASERVEAAARLSEALARGSGSS